MDGLLRTRSTCGCLADSKAGILGGQLCDLWSTTRWWTRDGRIGVASEDCGLGSVVISLHSPSLQRNGILVTLYNGFLRPTEVGRSMGVR